jgi:hypothetical protein
MKMRLTILVVLLAGSLATAAAPPTPGSKAIDNLLELISEGDAKAVQQAYAQLARAFPGKEVADEATWHYACFHVQQGRLNQAQDLLLSLRRAGRENRWVSLAVIGLSEVAQKRGDERAMLQYLKEGLKVPAAPTARNLMDTLDTRQEAAIRLARHYRDKGEFKQALAYFTRWEPWSWCHTCLGSMRAEREREIALCRLHLGDHAALSRDRLRQLQKDDWLSAFDSWLLWRLYRDAGQLADLRRMLDDYEKGRKAPPPEEKDYPPPTDGARQFLRGHALAEKKDVAALVLICQEEGRRTDVDTSEGGEGDLRRCAAAEALAGVGGAEVEAIKSALARRPKVTGWLIYALGRSSAPSALKVLREVAERERGGDYFMTRNLAYALALQGEPGKRAIRRLAEQESEMGKAAREWLRRKAQPAWPVPTWPRPKAGSLPKSLPGVR